jgi:hypothetical protein
MNVTIQKLYGLWHLIVGSCQIRTPFLETQERALIVGYARRVYRCTRAPRSSNATDCQEGNEAAVLTQVKCAPPAFGAGRARQLGGMIGCAAGVQC